MYRDIVCVKAKCSDYYKLVKKIESINVILYEIKYDENYLYIKVSRKDYDKLCKYIVSYKFEIIDNTGIKKLKDVIINNKIFIICLIIGLVVFSVLKNMIFKINVIHENSEIREIIEDELDNYGIKILRFKKSYKNLYKIRKEILDKYPDKLDWMEFDLKGMVLNVRIEERIITDIKKENRVCNLVATSSGIITDINVSNGEVKVMINDYVRKGDILVSGVVTYNEEDKRYTCANGTIYATIFYSVNVSMPFKYSEYIETGKSKYNLVYETKGGKKSILRSQFKNHNSNLKPILSIFDFNLYLNKEKEVIKKEKNYTKEEALDMAINKALENVEKKLNEKDEIIDKKVLKKNINDSKMDIDVFVVVKKIISTQEEITIEKGID